MLININRIKSFLDITTSYSVRLPYSPKKLNFTKYVRPENYRFENIFLRLKNAYGVLTGKYDALSWENLYKDISDSNQELMMKIDNILKDGFCEVDTPELLEYFLYIYEHELYVVRTYIALAKLSKDVNRVRLHCFYDYDFCELQLMFMLELNEPSEDPEINEKTCDAVFAEFFEHADSTKIILS